MNVLTLLPFAICSSWVALGVCATLRVRAAARRTHLPDDVRPVSILKPLSGRDADLASNLASFFVQDHPDFEIVFGVTRADDPAIEVVRELMGRYPHVAAKLVVHDGARGMNPKVANLLGMQAHATHDTLLVSDSNVRAPRHYVREMAAHLTVHEAAGERPGLVTNLFAGVGEDGLGSALENVQLAGFCASGMALATLAGDALVVGKSMMFSRRVLDELGGLERVADVLAEDWLLGKMYQHAGLRVTLAPTVLANVTSGMTVRDFGDRQLRWAMIRSRLRPLAQLLEVVASPLALLPFAIAVLGAKAAIVWALATLVVRDVGGWIALRGRKNAWIPFALAPVRELLMFVVWLRAPFKRHVAWRGHVVRVGMGTFGFLSARKSVVKKPLVQRG